MSGILEKIVLRTLRKRQFDSTLLRDIFRKRYGIEVGMYSYGCFCPQRIAAGTRIGRYCSIAETVRVLNGNHGLHFLTLHPFTYNTTLGVVDKETITRTRCVIEDDVWIGHNAMILPNVSRVGRGAVIAAGAVVTKDVAPYAIVAGNPARVLRMRFDEELIAQIEASRWWEWDKAELARQIRECPELVYQPARYFAAEKRR